MHQLLVFKNEKLRRQALTHRSYLNEHPGESEHNERLEFLGDAILNFLSANFLFNRYPHIGEGELTRWRSSLVEEKQLAKFAQEIGLETEMLLGKGAIRDGGYQNPNLLSSTFEAIVGGYYVDKNFNIEEIRKVIEELFASFCDEAFRATPTISAKSQLQEFVQRHISSNPPKYNTKRIGGSDNAPKFIAKVVIADEEHGEGCGNSKAKAEESAAADALAKLTAFLSSE